MDPQQQQQANQMAALMAGGVGLFFAVFGLAVLIFGIYLLWRIFAKAGFSGALSLLVLIPLVGAPIALCILAFGTWKVVPAPQNFGGSYPPPPPVGGGYPPQQFPPSNYPPQV